MPVTKLFKAILLFLLFFSSYKGNSQSYLLSSFPAEKELSSRQITCFFQDSKGFMWIGTADGLDLYNANSVKIFKHNTKDTNSLINNYIQDVCEDKNGNIWIGTATGVDCFMIALNKFIHYKTDDSGKLFGFKSKVFIDNKGSIWIGCDGLFKLDTKQNKFKRIVNTYHSFLDAQLSNFISGFYNDSHGRYWVSTKDGLYLYDDDKKHFTRFDVPPTDDSYRKTGILFSLVYEDKTGNLYAGTWGYGLFKILPEQKKLLPIGKKDVVLTYAEQQLYGKKILWCSAQGLSAVNTITNNVEAKIIYNNNDPFSRRNDDVTALFTDKQNQLWIGYEQSGLQIINPGNQLIKTYNISSGNDRHKINLVLAILKTNTYLYAGGWYSDALCQLDNDFSVKKWWSYLPSSNNTHTSNVGDIYIDKNQNLWVASFNGLISVDAEKNKIQQYKFDSSAGISNRFLKIKAEGDSVLWLAGFNNGLSRFSLKTHKLQCMSNPLSKKIYWNIASDKKGNIWCANNEGFIEKFDKQKFIAYRFDSLTENSMYNDIIYDSVYNNLWIASTNGLLKFDPQNLRAQLFTEKEGLPTTHINLLCFDYKHRLWIGTDKGLSLYDKQHNFFQNFYANNGLTTEKLSASLSAGPDGMLYIGANNNIMVMNIDAIDTSAEIQPVYITGVYENEILLQPEIKQDNKIIELPYDQNALSFEFAIADYINPEDNELLYKLEGWDKNFIQTKNGKVNYNKLPPGKYTFIVKGINHNGIRNDKGDAVTIIIHPPYWQTWWFIVIVSAAILMFIIVAVRYISQRNLRDKLLRLEKEQAIEKERNRISQDMHDDLGSGLTKIAIMSEVVKRQIHEPGKAKMQLENISASSRELVDNLQDIIWILNPKNDTLENLAAYIREYSLKFFEPFGTDIQFEYPEKFPEIKLSEETRRNIFLTIKESLNNIAKHAWCNKVKISIQPLKNEITFRIKDDGEGFDLNLVRQFGNGLANMQNRIEHIGGSYKIISAPGKGTETSISVFV